MITPTRRWINCLKFARGKIGQRDMYMWRTQGMALLETLDVVERLVDSSGEAGWFLVAVQFVRGVVVKARVRRSAHGRWPLGRVVDVAIARLARVCHGKGVARCQGMPLAHDSNDSLRPVSDLCGTVQAEHHPCQLHYRAYLCKQFNVRLQFISHRLKLKVGDSFTWVAKFRRKIIQSTWKLMLWPS